MGRHVILANLLVYILCVCVFGVIFRLCTLLRSSQMASQLEFTAFGYKQEIRHPEKHVIRNARYDVQSGLETAKWKTWQELEIIFTHVSRLLCLFLL